MQPNLIFQSASNKLWSQTLSYFSFQTPCSANFNKVKSTTSRHVSMITTNPPTKSTFYYTSTMFACRIFHNILPQDREALLRKQKSYTCCLGKHSLSDCPSHHSCRKYQQRHHLFHHIIRHDSYLPK